MAVAIAVEEKLFTVEEWLEFEQTADVRHEFHYGKLLPMAGEARHANRIAINIIKKLDDDLEEKGFQMYGHEVKCEVELNGIYRYPDLLVAPIVDDESVYIVKLPVMVVEVASVGSANRDRVKKRNEYRKIASLWHYLIVDQEEMIVELHSKTEDGNWNVKVVTEPEDVVEFARFGLQITVAEIYRKYKLSV